MCAAPPDLSVILVSWNTRDLLLACIDSLAASIGALSADIWVVDNGSTDGSVDAVRSRFPAVRVLVNEHNPGFAAANNQAMRASNGRYALLLNSDTIVCPRAIERLVRFADAHPRAGIVGGLLLNSDGSFQYSFSDFPSLASELLSATGLGERLFHRSFPSYSPRQSRAARQVDVIPGACMLARRAAFEQIGLMDEGYFMYSEEPDWCLRMRRAGWEAWYLPEARIIHYGGQSTGQVRHAMVQALYRSKVRFFQKHYGVVPAMTLRAGLVAVRQGRRLIQQIRSQGRGGVEPAISWGDLRSTSLDQAKSSA